jgi:PD-(D/E)XK nuclease superfamily
MRTTGIEGEHSEFDSIEWLRPVTFVAHGFDLDEVDAVRYFSVTAGEFGYDPDQLDRDELDDNDHWSAYRNLSVDYSRGDTWDSMLHEGVHLLERFAQDDRVRIRNPRRDLQVKIARRLSSGNDFVAYIDAIGQLDDKHSIIDWKTSSARYPDEPAGLLTLDQQLVCYSWIASEPEVAFVVFVRKRLPEIQYLRSTISEEQRREFGQLVEDTVAQIEAAQFLPRSGIRFPQNPCLSCPFLGLCLGNQQLIEVKLNRCPGAEDFAWLDELHY